MSPRQVTAHRLPRVDRIGGSREMLQGTWLAPALVKYLQHCGSRRQELAKSGHPRHQRGFVHPLSLGASEGHFAESEFISWGTMHRGHELQTRQGRKMFAIKIPF
jgi:hypothetical protein